MKLIAAAVAGLVTVGAGVASAQPMWGPEEGRFYGPERRPVWQRDRGWVGAMTPRQAAYIIEAMGLDPVGPPTQTGHLLVQRAADEFGRVMRVTVNLNTSRVVSIAPAGEPPPVNGGPYATYRPYGPGPYGRPMPEADDDDEFAPPGRVMPPRADLPPGPYAPGPGAAPPPRSAAVAPYPPSVIEGAPPAPRSAAPYPTPAYPANPQAAVPPKGETHKPATKSATATPTNPPLPRKRPDNPQAAATKSAPGSVAPIQSAPAAGVTPAPGAAPAGAIPPAQTLE